MRFLGKPRIRLETWSQYRPKMFRCYDGHSEGWGDTFRMAFSNYERVKEDLESRGSVKRSWRK